MNLTVPATSVIDEVRTWSGVSTRPPPAKVLAAARASEWFENWVTKGLASDGDAEDPSSNVSR